MTNVLTCVVVSPVSQLPSASQLVLWTVCPMIAVWQESGWAVGELGALISPFLCSGRRLLSVSGVSPGIRRDLRGGVASWMRFGGRTGVESGQRVQQEQRPGSVWRWQAGHLWGSWACRALCPDSLAPSPQVLALVSPPGTAFPSSPCPQLRGLCRQVLGPPPSLASRGSWEGSVLSGGHRRTTGS